MAGQKLAIFDLDGTLLNTIQDLGVACNVALQHFGFPTHESTEYPHLVGNGVNKLIERALPEGEKTEANILRLREIFIPYYNDHNRVFTKPYDDIAGVLMLLKTRGYLLAVASNKYQAATQELVTHYFPNTFNVIYGERDNCPRKPHPQIVHDILVATHTDPTDTIFYIGDSDVDMQTAQNANLPAIACLWGFCLQEQLTPYNPQYLLTQPIQLLDILK